MVQQYLLPNWTYTNSAEEYQAAWGELVTVVREFFPQYEQISFNPQFALKHEYLADLFLGVTEVQSMKEYRDRMQAEIDALKAELKATRDQLKDFYKAKWRWEIPRPPYAVRMPQEAVIAKLEELLAKDPFDRAAIIEAAYWDEGVLYDWDDDIAALSHKVREHFEVGWQRLNAELGEP